VNGVSREPPYSPGWEASATSAINDAQTLVAAIHFNGITHDKLSAAQNSQANSLAITLDRYNNNLLC
jgi:hypothetical protein